MQNIIKYPVIKNTHKMMQCLNLSIGLVVLVSYTTVQKFGVS